MTRLSASVWSRPYSIPFSTATTRAATVATHKIELLHPYNRQAWNLGPGGAANMMFTMVLDVSVYYLTLWERCNLADCISLL